MRASSSQTFRTLRILAFVVPIVIAFGYLSHIRAQNTTPTTRVVPIRPLAPLSSVPVPEVPGLSDYVADKAAAIALGKTLFWDMQAGSDGMTACASCHFNAGADSRFINQVSPGIKAGDATFQMGVPLNGMNNPNYKLNPGTAGAGFGGYHDGDFPLNKQGDVNTRNNPQSDVNDVVGSQGVFSSSFDRVQLFRGAEKTTLTSDQIFSYPDPAGPTKTIDTRRVEPRNTPSAVNAVFNNRSFWDGRAQNTCNGANPFGERDANSHFFMASSIAAPLASKLVRLQNSSLCSQALGPPGSPFEMSAANRTFRDIGLKLLTVRPLLNNSATPTPLGRQRVRSDDSVLGKKGRSGGMGLMFGYISMIKAAFKPEWWQSNQFICVAADGSETLINPVKRQICPKGAIAYPQMIYNFSLFWGIAIQMYESTLIANQTPLDQYLAQQQSYSLTGDNLKNFYTIQLPAGINPLTVSLVELNPQLDASDQEVFAFDDGAGQVSGVGITSGTIDY
jgi:cytochrome c peroxidase